MTLPTLLAELEKAEGPDFELDKRIAIAVLGMVEERRRKDRKVWLYDDAQLSDSIYYRWLARYNTSRFAGDYDRLPRFTNSLEACILLQERVLPGVDMSVATCGPHVPGWCASLSDAHPEQGDPWIAVCQQAGTPAIALLIAIVRALIAQGGEDE